MTRGAGEDHVKKLPHDHSTGLNCDDEVRRADTLIFDLTAHFIIWLASPEATFLKGRFVLANWDVKQLKDKTAEIEGGMELTANMLGLPFPKHLS